MCKLQTRKQEQLLEHFKPVRPGIKVDLQLHSDVKFYFQLVEKEFSFQKAFGIII